MLIDAIAVVAAYLLGSVSFAVVVSRAMGLADPRSYGSGNPGATNVLRTGNRTAAVLTLAGDALKGLVAVLAARALGVSDGALAAVAVAVFAGHLWPVFHGFAGGKGVATAAGVLLGLWWPLGLATLATWIVILAFFRYSSLSALVAAVFAPFFCLLVFDRGAIAIAVTTIAALLVWRHRANLARLVAGTEPRVGRRSSGG